MDKQSSAFKGSANSLDSGADSKQHSPVPREVEPGSLRSFLQASQTELDDADDEFDPRKEGAWPAGNEDDGYPQEEDEEESEGESIDGEDDFDTGYDGALDESAILPYIPDPTAYGLSVAQMQQPRPYLLIANEALRHFWEQYFADKQYVRWTTFVNKLEIHLSSPAQNDTQEAESKNPTIQTGAKVPARQQDFPVAPNGYGLHPNELFTLFREREGKRNLTKALQYALDFDGSGVLSVYQVAIVVQHVLPASLPLKHLLFHLAHLGGKVILPATLYPVTSAAKFAARLQDAFQRAVAAEKDFTIQQQKNQQLARAAGKSNASGEAAATRAAAEMSHSMVGLYSPYAYCNEDLQGPVALQDSIETFIGVGRGIYNNQDNASTSGGVTVLAAPCGQGATSRVVAAVRSQLHNTLHRRHALLNHAAAQGSLSVWDLLHGDQTTDVSRTAATLLAALPLTQTASMQKEVYTVKQVADDDFVLGGLFDVVYIDLRGRTSKADVLTAFSTQLALRGADVSLRAVQESLQRFLRSLRTSSVLILDHVHSSCAAVVKKLLSSSLTLSVEKNAVSVVVIPAMQCASPILSANAGEAINTSNPKLQKYYGSAGRRRIAWEKEQEAKSTTYFLEELKMIVTNFGIRWNSSSNQNGETQEESAEELVLPNSVMLMTYCLTTEETRAAAVKMHQEVQIRERLMSLQRQEVAGAAPVVLHSEALTLECLDSITALSGGIPGLIRLLLFQSAETLNYLIARRNELATSTNMPSYMSSANTVRGSTSGAASPANRLAALGSTVGAVGAASSPGHPTSNPYSGLPSLYSIGWELQQPAALSFTDEDRLLFYALSPLLYLHLHITPTGSSKDPTGSMAKFSASNSSANQPASASPAPSTLVGTRTSSVRPAPLMFDGSLAWHLSKDLFLLHVSAQQGTQNNVQTYTGRRGVVITKPESKQDQAYQKFLRSWNKMVVTGWFQEWNQGLTFPTISPVASEAYSTVPNTVVHFTDAAVPQFLTVKKAMLAHLSAAVCEVASEEQLMKSYLQYVTRKFQEYSEVLAVIDKLLITPEAGYQSSLLQQRQLLVLRSVDHLLLPHFTLLTSLMTTKLTAPVRSDRSSKRAAMRPESKISSFKLRSASGVSNKSSNNAESFFAAEASEDDGEHSDHRSDRAPSISSDNSDPIQLLRDGTRSTSGRMSEAIDQALSYSLEEEDRASEDGGSIPKRIRTASEASSDDGGEHYNYAHNAERGLQNLNATSSESAAADGKNSADEESYLMSPAEAKEILSQWNGHLKHLSLLRLAPDLCTTLAVHSSKNLDSAAKSAAGPDAINKKVDYALAVLDLGLLLQELYLEHSSESNLSSGWSRGSLHYSSVESAVSRHLAASSSKLLQEASEVVQRILRAGSSTASAVGAAVPAKPALSKKMVATLLGLQTKIEYALGHLSLAISAEALRMSLIAGATTSKIDEILVVKLHNKSRIAQTHGLDILQNVLPATAAQLSAVLDSLDESPHRSTPIRGLRDPWEQYRAELSQYVVPIASCAVVASPPPSPVKGIGMGTARSAEAAAEASESIVLPDMLSTLLDKLYVRKLEGDAVLLVAEHFVQQALNRKLGEVNATFVQCMAPPATAPAKADDNKEDKSEALTIRASPSDSNLPLPKGILPATRSATDLAHRDNADGLITESKPVTETPPRGKSGAFFADQTQKEQEAAAKKKIHKNIMFPILLHSGRQDLLRELLDREFLVHQQKFLDKLTAQQDAISVSTLVASGLPSPVNNKSPPRSAGKPGVANPLTQDEPSLLFNEELSAEEDAELAAMTAPVTTFIATKFTNAALVHCWRVAKQNYEAAMQVYVKLFGANSIAAAEMRILLANLHRYFGRDDEAKPLYELSLKVFKAQSVATFQLPTATIAHCWLGLASYFDQHNAVLGSVYDSRIAVVNSNVHKSKNDLALRLYDEALSIYKCVYPSTHFNVGLTAQAVVGVLTGLKRYARAITLLTECIDSTKLVLGRDRIMQRYMNRQLRLASRKPSGRSAANSKKSAARATAIARLERSIESNELALQATIGYLGTLLVSLARLHDHNKQHHLAIVLYKEAIVCFRELRLSIIRKYRARLDANAGADSKADGDNTVDTQADEVEQIVTNQPERELALRLAQTMRDLAQSLFDEGVKQMGGRRANGLSLPDFQYRHALYVINRAIEIYHGFDLSVSAVLLKDTYTQKAAMHTQQGELENAKSCYEQIMRLFMEVKFQNYEDIAAVRTEYGRLMVQCGESGEAALLFQQAIDVYRRKRGENWIGIEVAENLLERGAALLDLKVYDEAQPCLEDVLKMLPMVLGESVAAKDPRFAACHNHLAAVFHFYEEYDEALVHYKAAQQTYINAGMHFSLEMANVCNNLATLHDDMGQLAEAKEMYEQTVVILFRFHGAAHPQILVTLENLMNLLQDMGLKEEHQSVLDHLDVMEKQIVQANKDDIERTEALNRALYGQAIADQERRQLKAQTRRMDQSAHPASPSSTSGAANGNAFSTAGDFSAKQPSQSQRHPFAPEVVIVGGGTYDDDTDDDAGEEAFGGYNADVLLNFQAQEQAQYDDQQDSFFTLGLQRNTSTTRMVTAEEEWCRTNSARTLGRGMDDHQDEEDGGQWGIKTGSALEAAAREAARHGSLNLDLDYLGNYNNSSELHAMKQDLTSKYSASGSGGSGGDSLAQKARFGSEARRGGAPGGKIRSLKPLGPAGSRAAAAQQAEQDDELPAGNCAIM